MVSLSRRFVYVSPPLAFDLVTTACKVITPPPPCGNETRVSPIFLQIDVNVTEAANEAKDNVKFLYTLERFIEPLYSGTATTIIDTLPALMNSIKMIHTIAR